MSTTHQAQYVAGVIVAATSVGLAYQAIQYMRRNDEQLTQNTEQGVNSPTQTPYVDRSMTPYIQDSIPVYSIAQSPPESNRPVQVQPVIPVQESQSAQQTADTQPLLNLLFNIAEEQARQDGYVHRGVTCNICGQSPLCGVRFKCASCIDYDICERCEPKDLHNRTHLFIKIRVPLPPLANPRMPLFKPLYPGKERNSSTLSWEEICKYKKETFFDQFEIEGIYEQYKSLSSTEKGISREVFDQCLGPLALRKNLVIDRLFKYYDRNDDKYIDFSEMVLGMSVLVKGNKMDKLPYAFDGYDLDNKGSISKENLRRMFKGYFNITIELVRDVVKACEEEMMANFDDSSGKPVSSLFSAPIPAESTNNNINSKTPIPANPGGRETMWPVMEAMSQDAIDEMVDNIFKMAKLRDGSRMTFQKFKEVALLDGSLVAWFDALGTVF